MGDPKVPVNPDWDGRMRAQARKGIVSDRTLSARDAARVLTWGDHKLQSATVPGPVVLVLPEPPSANVYWRQVKGRTYVTHEAREYRRAALYQ